MKPTIFWDTVRPKPYAFDQLGTTPMGGTEATVLRVSEALRAHGDIRLIQEKEIVQPKDAQNVIVLRQPSDLLDVRWRYPDANLYLWLHDLPDATFVTSAHIIPETRAKVICVSEFHKMVVMEAMRQGGVQNAQVSYIYNPVDTGTLLRLSPDDVDRSKLIYFSSPHKGLKRALELFQMVHYKDATMRLYVANPGYLDLPPIDQPGVVILGPRPHKEVLREVRDSLCVFYPNAVFPETFGLVFAEANALGTPVLTHGIGAAREVLYHPSEILDTNNYKAVVDRVFAWKSGTRPVVRAKSEFKLTEVIKKWERILA